MDLTFAISIAAITLLFNRALLNSDGDPARHLVIGRHIWTHGPRFEDPFSFSRLGEPFLAYEWLSQGAYAAAHWIGGLPAVALMGALLIATSLALVVAWVRREHGDPWLAFMTGALAAVVTYPHWLARPHLFSYVGLATLLHLSGRTRRIVPLAILFLVWANLHPGFLYGLIILAVFLSGEFLERLRTGSPLRVALKSFVPLVVAALASLITPFGWALHVHAISWLGSTTVGFVDEFQPLAILSGHGVVYVGIAGLLVLGLALQQRWVGWHVVLVFWAAFIAGLLARRNAPLFALFALPLAVRALTPLVQGVSWPWLSAMRTEFARSDRSGWIISRAVVVALVALLAIDARIPTIDVVSPEFSAEVFPAEAVREAREQKLTGRLLSKYEWGGYVLYAWPGQRLFIDSMADFFGDELIGKYSTMARGAAGWEALMAEYDISIVLFPPDVPLVRTLKAAGGWRVVYEDAVAVLLARDGLTPAPY